MRFLKSGRTIGPHWHYGSHGTIFPELTRTLRVTPAMEAGIADHVWTLRELIEAS
jgi:hypothetical protein